MVQKNRPITNNIVVFAFVVGQVAFGLDPIAILAPSDVPPNFGTGFGNAVAISGDYIAVGAPDDPWNNGNSIGAVYVFRRIGPNWVEQAKLTASDGQYPDQLGWSVDMDGDVIVAGAPGWEFNYCDIRRPGAAYVFRRNDAGTLDDLGDDFWIEEAKLTAPLPQHGIGLGMSVAVSGDTIVVGSDCGESAEVFRHQGGSWNFEISLVEPEAGAFHEFGSSVSIDCDQIAIGSHGYDGRRGAAYVFARGLNGWSFEQQLRSVGAQEVDDFGRSVAISDGFIVASAPNEDLGWPQSSLGAAYLFEHGTKGWGEHEKLTGPRTRSSAYFGWAVAIDKNALLIPAGIGGFALLFERGPLGYTETTRLVETDDSPDVSASLDGKYAVISTQIYVVRERKNIFDFAAFQNCFDATPCCCECEKFDFDGNELIDFRDFGEVMALFGGP